MVLIHCVADTLVERCGPSRRAPSDKELLHGLVGFEIIHVCLYHGLINLDGEIYSDFHLVLVFGKATLAVAGLDRYEVRYWAAWDLYAAQRFVGDIEYMCL